MKNIIRNKQKNHDYKTPRAVLNISHEDEKSYWYGGWAEKKNDQCGIWIEKWYLDIYLVTTLMIIFSLVLSLFLPYLSLLFWFSYKYQFFLCKSCLSYKLSTKLVFQISQQKLWLLWSKWQCDSVNYKNKKNKTNVMSFKRPLKVQKYLIWYIISVTYKHLLILFKSFLCVNLLIPKWRESGILKFSHKISKVRSIIAK